MSFLTKHFEKIILAIVLLIFIGALAWLIQVVRNASKISGDQLLVTQLTRPDYRKFDFSAYNCVESLTGDTEWHMNAARDTGSLEFTDFMLVFPAARSPFCGKIIPYRYFEKKLNCPYTGQPLVSDEAPKGPIVPADVDKDEDGIPDEEETKYGMNPRDPGDLEMDVDADGFSNKIEYAIDHSWVNDKKKHPPLAERLYLVKVKRVRLPFQIDKVTKRSNEDKKSWLIQGKLNKKTKFMHVGDAFEMDGKEYKIMDVIYKTVEVLNEALHQTVDQNVSEVVIKAENEAPITCVVGKPTYDLKEKILLRDLFSDQKFTTEKGEAFKLGDKDVGFEKYVVTEIAANEKSVKIARNDNKEFTIVTKEKMKYVVPKTSSEGPKKPLEEEMLIPEDLRINFKRK